MGEGGGLTPAERQLRVALLVIALESAGFAVYYVLRGWTGHSEYPFTVNSTAKDATFALLALIAFADVRRNGWLTALLAGAHVVLAATLATMLVAGHADMVTHTMGDSKGLSAQTSCVVWLSADVVIASVLSWMYWRAGRARHGLQYLWPGQFRCLAAVSEILTERAGPDEPGPQEVALTVDHYLHSFTAIGKRNIRLGLLVLSWYPVVLSLRPPLWLMAPDARRRYLQKRFVDDVANPHGLPFLVSLRQTLIRTAQQMAFLGFYSDTAVGERCGYITFRNRPEYPELAERVTPDRPGVVCMAHSEVRGGELDADVVVIGSGAAGATIAAELADKGRDVLLLERGRHVDPSQFTEDEPTQFSALYADGALTLTKDFHFQVLQGMCVGGSTVVNNAVCFDLPDPKVHDWCRKENSAVDEAQLDAAYKRVRESIGVQDMRPGRMMTPVWKPFVAGITNLGLKSSDYANGPVQCNISDCIGCGYCNIGCAYGKKLSMLDLVLPRAQAKHGTDRVRVLAECRVDRIEHRGGVATGVQCVLGEREALHVRANEVVVAAGAIASSVLLQRSRIGGPLTGRQLGFNLGVPMVGDFDEPIHAERGLQISHFLDDVDGRFTLETWGQPLTSMSLFMPGWFGEHERNMQRYPHMACVGTVVGSASEAVVKPGRDKRSVKMTYDPSKTDLAKLTAGMKLAGRIMLAGGARRVMPPSMGFHEYHSAASLEELPAHVSHPHALSVNSAHPQGGNRLSRDSRDGVVGPDFRVHGMENVTVCDASVFPSTITVNPQLTVMALATCAAQYI